MKRCHEKLKTKNNNISLINLSFGLAKSPTMKELNETFKIGDFFGFFK